MNEPRSQVQPAIRTRPARRGPPPLARSLAPHMRRLAARSGAMDPVLAAEWAAIAGPELAPLCRPVRIIRRGRSQALELAVKNGAAAMRVRYAQEALLGRVRQRLGLPHLKQLVFREGAERRSWESRKVEVEPAPAAKDEAKGPKAETLRAALEDMRRTIRKGRP